ncbi:MAG: DNA polymerase III subunit delta' [Hyphomicrobiales bacterium]|nr:DNA polymerase III subunit delta' [Hyphomicrobiales bacterium]
MARTPKAKHEGDGPPLDPDLTPGATPARFTPRVFGHDAARAAFRAALDAGRLHHAWLIAGEAGVGKATLAYALARRVLAGGDAGAADDPDSPLFRQVAALSHPRLIAVRRPWQPPTGKFSAAIPVEEIRRLKHFFETTADGGWRVAVIDRADDLNPNAANALLKLLEEPPPLCVFLLVSSVPGRLPQTIRSRCRRLDLRPLDDADVRLALAAALSAPPDERALTAALANAAGSPGRAARRLAEDDGARALSGQLIGALPRLDLSAVFAALDAGGDQAAAIERLLDALEADLEMRVRGAAIADQAERAGARPLFSRANLALWAGLWETVRGKRADAERLNLDRATLLVGVLTEFQAAADAAR